MLQRLPPELIELIICQVMEGKEANLFCAYWHPRSLEDSTVLFLSQTCRATRPIALKSLWREVYCNLVSKVHALRRLLHDQQRLDLASYMLDVQIAWEFQTMDIEENYPHKLGWGVDYSFIDREKIRSEERSKRGIVEPPDGTAWSDAPTAPDLEGRVDNRDQAIDWKYSWSEDYAWGSGPDMPADQRELTDAWTNVEQMPAGYGRASLEADLLLILSLMSHIKVFSWGGDHWRLPEKSSKCLGKKRFLHRLETDFDYTGFEPYLSDLWHAASAPNLKALALHNHSSVRYDIHRDQSWLRRTNRQTQSYDAHALDVGAFGACMSNSLPVNPIFPLDINKLPRGWALGDHEEEGYAPHLQGRTKTILTSVAVGSICSLELSDAQLFGLRLMLPVWLALDVIAKVAPSLASLHDLVVEPCCIRLRTLRVDLWPCLDLLDQAGIKQEKVDQANIGAEKRMDVQEAALRAAATWVKQECAKTNVPDVQFLIPDYDYRIRSDASEAERRQVIETEENRQKLAIAEDNPQSEYRERIPPFRKWLAEDEELAANVVRGLVYWRDHHNCSPAEINV
ncbi:hypothetical protein CBOM_05352 [Ceraceosorus bombacis]|uniref:Uncharacterized protein n=1 Tax=Ceraceosorus bombacis TaxID=401625 RepID=A0A0P1BQA3_9BASI|nr:hypothetical protein CBOM_05352 [Ceraceosorus bombacis]